MPSPTLIWIFRAVLAICLGVIGWFIREFHTDSKEWRSAITLKVDTGLHHLGQKIDAVKDRVEEQNGSIRELDTEIKTRVIWAQERHEANMKEHDEMYAQLRTLAISLGERQVAKVRRKMEEEGGEP